MFGKMVRARQAKALGFVTLPGGPRPFSYMNQNYAFAEGICTVTVGRRRLKRRNYDQPRDDRGRWADCGRVYRLDVRLTARERGRLIWLVVKTGKNASDLVREALEKYTVAAKNDGIKA